MDKADRLDRVNDDLEDRSADPAPIIIVQRGRATWGRELLLLLLLLATASYIVYEEYRGPSIIVRNSPRQDPRVVDSVSVTALSPGDVVIRGSDGDARKPSSQTDDRVTSSGDDGVEAGSAQKSSKSENSGAFAVAREDEGESDEPGDEAAPREGIALEARGDSVVDPFGFPEPLADRDPAAQEAVSKPEDAEAPRRASAVIVWDQDRLDPPRRDRPNETDGPGDRLLDDRLDPPQSKDVPPERKVAIQTLAQRRHFLQCLALAIRQYGRQAGPHIDGLCRDYRIPLPFEVVQLEQRYGSNVFLSGGDLEQTITTLRHLGAPESYLLEQLSEQMSRTIGARHGPRNAMEARVFAARKLLTIPLPDGLQQQAASRPSIGG
ncbi:hypothetical protein [Tautonia marina]|uniref:hypothetical protein n=1 Tax=Tautonia marina TaxID=2653855 RepID=UPI001375A156|nr:hypothetical protein [Tautonia marina]